MPGTNPVKTLSAKLDTATFNAGKRRLPIDKGSCSIFPTVRKEADKRVSNYVKTNCTKPEQAAYYLEQSKTPKEKLDVLKKLSPEQIKAIGKDNINDLMGINIFTNGSKSGREYQKAINTIVGK